MKNLKMKNFRMNRKFFLVLVISVLVAFSMHAEDNFSDLDIKIPVFKTVSYYAAAVTSEEDIVIPHGIANNEFYTESLRLSRLAVETFEYGDYDASAGFAQDAIRYAQLSDEFVVNQLITEAERLMVWAETNNFASRFPLNFNEGKEYYEAALEARSNEEWDDAIDAAIRSVGILAAFESGRPAVITASTTTSNRTGTTDSTALPRQYTVRTWRVERDCLWNIAGYPWVYGDPWRWRELYEANKSNLPNPDNPDLILPGMILDIPR